MIDERPCALRYEPLARLQSLIWRDILSMAWAIRSKNDLMLLISPSTAPTLAVRMDCSSSSPVIVGKFAEALIPLDARSGKDE